MAASGRISQNSLFKYEVLYENRYSLPDIEESVTSNGKLLSVARQRLSQNVVQDYENQLKKIPRENRTSTIIWQAILQYIAGQEKDTDELWNLVMDVKNEKKKQKTLLEELTSKKAKADRSIYSPVPNNDVMNELSPPKRFQKCVDKLRQIMVSIDGASEMPLPNKVGINMMIADVMKDLEGSKEMFLNQNQHEDEKREMMMYIKQLERTVQDLEKDKDLLAVRLDHAEKKMGKMDERQADQESKISQLVNIVNNLNISDNYPKETVASRNKKRINHNV